MRSVTDTEGGTWDVTVGRESWGGVMLLFAPKGGGEVRVADLATNEVLEAERQLAQLSDEKLLRLLASARPWSG
jgi:hypothetical protein